ncbi:hypothetical protein M8C21_023058 [Ambrosia artemisiifolia]|uniref:transaldolase n=1 Tax=Ambrosia artemisiifolia TaxID=4212 RepID=A0AAD5BXG3_AMBAR|nr:hypothetical protein M8C21_023058 [Ambrosia artemisiifolia]
MSTASLTSSSIFLQDRRTRFSVPSVFPVAAFTSRRSFTQIRASFTDFTASPNTGGRTELDALSHYSEVVPDTVVFDDFERFPPTAATVSSSLLLGICSLPDTTFKGAVDTALAAKECYGLGTPDARMTCFVNKALVNVGGELSKLVPGRVSTEVENLLQLYNSIDVPAERLLFKIPATWQGIEAARLLESEGIQTHLTFVYSFCQAAAAAQAGASVIQIFVGRLRDWARNHSGDPEVEAALKRGEDPGLALVTKAYNYIHKYGHKSKLMVASIRNKQDVFNVLGVDYIITPLKILQALKESVTPDDDKYTFVKRLSSQSAAAYNFTDEELVKWDQLSFASGMGPAALELLASGMDGYSNQAKRVEELFGKIWPPPNYTFAHSTSSDVENPIHVPLLVDDHGYVASLDASDQPSRPQETNQQPSKPVLLFISGLLSIGLLVVLIVGNVHIETSHNCDVPLPDRRDPIEQGVSGKSFGLPDDAHSFSWTDHILSWQAPAFHFSPGKNWMNDPNGPVYYKGWYHLFYQYSPKAPVWGLIVWGHAVSRDMVHWRHLPIAMETDQWYDANGVWTGSTTILPNNELVVLYTGLTNESVQVQNLAYPANPSDPLLVNWVKDLGNPVLVPPKWINKKDFRDPTTAWLTRQGKWRMVIGSKVNRTGIALLYDTKDFKSYELQDTSLHQVAGTGMWECVDFYPVSKNESALDTGTIGPDVKHVLKASMDDDRSDYYAIGNYNPKTGKWVPDNPKIDVGYGLRYDYGTYYASKTFYDQNKNRRILWSWIKETDSENTDIKKGWASLMAIPRIVALDPLTGSNLLQWPIEELDKLRSNLKEFNEVKLEPGSLVPLNVGPTSQVDIMVEFELDKKVANSLRLGSGVPYNCAGHGGAGVRGALGPFGLSVLANKNLTEHTPTYFYIAKGAHGDLDTFFCIDQSRSSIAKDVDKSIYGSTVPVLKGEKLSMRILVDHSIVEGYAQGGRTCVTSRVYPTKAINDDAQLFLFNNATNVTVRASLKIWQMGHTSNNNNCPES